MVTFITGDINSGKTSALEKYCSCNTSSGYLCRKTFSGGIHSGYDLVSVCGEKQYSFIRKDQFADAGETQVFKIGPYNFSEKAFLSVQQDYHSIISSNPGNLCIDELGPLELQKKGFYDVMASALAKDIPVTACVRS